MKEIWGAPRARCSFSETQFLPNSLSWLASFPLSTSIFIPSRTPAHISSLLCPVFPPARPLCSPSIQPPVCLCLSLPAQNPAVALWGVAGEGHLLGRACWELLALPDLFSPCYRCSCVQTCLCPDLQFLNTPDSVLLVCRCKCCALDWSLVLQILRQMVSTSSVKFSVYTQAKSMCALSFRLLE